jgi:hypothetical protein
MEQDVTSSASYIIFKLVKPSRFAALVSDVLLLKKNLKHKYKYFNVYTHIYMLFIICCLLIDLKNFLTK